MAWIGPDGDIDAGKPHFIACFRHFVGRAKPLQVAGENVDLERLRARGTPRPGFSGREPFPHLPVEIAESHSRFYLT